MMFKALVLIALCASSVSSLQVPDGSEGIPEPYAYGYQTDTHAAAEEKDPSGRVTGYYTLVDNDGRQRRVEYVADESGFHAKVDTNELGTKTSNPADAVIQAAPANPEQLAYQAPAVQQVQVVQQPQLVRQQLVRGQSIALQQPLVSSLNWNTQANLGLNGGYALYPGLTNGGYLINRGYTSSILPQNQAIYGSNWNSVYGGYNLHTPGSYYQARGLTTVPVTTGSRILANQGLVNGQVVNGQIVNGQIVTSTLAAPQIISGVSRAADSSLLGSSNYVILKKKA